MNYDQNEYTLFANGNWSQDNMELSSDGEIYTVRFYTSIDQENEDTHYITVFLLFPSIDDTENQRQECIRSIT